jgi:hypothetical protein
MIFLDLVLFLFFIFSLIYLFLNFEILKIMQIFLLSRMLGEENISIFSLKKRNKFIFVLLNLLFFFFILFFKTIFLIIFIVIVIKIHIFLKIYELKNAKKFFS